MARFLIIRVNMPTEMDENMISVNDYWPDFWTPILIYTYRGSLLKYWENVIAYHKVLLK